MERIHSHVEIELNYVEQGEIHYLFGAEQRVFKAGTLCAFLGLEPHQLIYSSPDSLFSWLTIPISYFAGWNLSNNLTDRILSGEIIMDVESADAESDAMRFARWRQDLERDDPRYLRVILIEVQARLERLALNKELVRGKTAWRKVRGWSSPVSRMTACILQHLTDPELTLNEIAASANLNASYASTLFSRKSGASPIAFLTKQRLAYAKFMLVTTDLTVLDVALSCGFGSSSQFYAAFKKQFGHTPSELRKGNMRA